MIDYDAWLKEATHKTITLSAGSTFIVKELFDGIKWNKLTSGEKRDFGRRFKQEVAMGKIQNVRYIGKMQNGSCKYMKIN